MTLLHRLWPPCGGQDLHEPPLIFSIYLCYKDMRREHKAPCAEHLWGAAAPSTCWIPGESCLLTELLFLCSISGWNKEGANYTGEEWREKKKIGTVSTTQCHIAPEKQVISHLDTSDCFKAKSSMLFQNTSSNSLNWCLLLPWNKL